MSFLLNVARTLYRPVLKSNITFVGFIVGGAVFSELFFENFTNSLWSGFNRGKLWTDVQQSIAASKKD